MPIHVKIISAANFLKFVFEGKTKNTNQRTIPPSSSTMVRQATSCKVCDGCKEAARKKRKITPGICTDPRYSGGSTAPPPPHLDTADYAKAKKSKPTVVPPPPPPRPPPASLFPLPSMCPFLTQALLFLSFVGDFHVKESSTTKETRASKGVDTRARLGSIPPRFKAVQGSRCASTAQTIGKRDRRIQGPPPCRCYLERPPSHRKDADGNLVQCV